MKGGFVCLICIFLLLGACVNDSDPATVAPEETEESPTVEAFEDTDSLTLGRFVLINHLLQVEGITAVPFVDQWQPDGTWASETEQTYLFNSEEWQLEMVQPLTDQGEILYHVLLTGPDDFRYAAEIHKEGLIYPAQ